MSKNTYEGGFFAFSDRCPIITDIRNTLIIAEKIQSTNFVADIKATEEKFWPHLLETSAIFKENENIVNENAKENILRINDSHNPEIARAKASLPIEERMVPTPGSYWDRVINERDDKIRTVEQARDRELKKINSKHQDAMSDINSQLTKIYVNICHAYNQELLDAYSNYVQNFHKQYPNLEEKYINVKELINDLNILTSGTVQLLSEETSKSFLSLIILKDELKQIVQEHQLYHDENQKIVEELQATKELINKDEYSEMVKIDSEVRKYSYLKDLLLDNPDEETIKKDWAKYKKIIANKDTIKKDSEEWFKRIDQLEAKDISTHLKKLEELISQLSIRDKYLKNEFYSNYSNNVFTKNKTLRKIIDTLNEEVMIEKLKEYKSNKYGHKILSKFKFVKEYLANFDYKVSFQNVLDNFDKLDIEKAEVIVKEENKKRNIYLAIGGAVVILVIWFFMR